MSEYVSIENKGSIEWITFNRPEKANCISREALRKVTGHLEVLKNDDKIRTVIFTGAGLKSFSAGMNTNEFKGLNAQTAYELISDLKEFCEIVRKIPQVVIVAINGYCIGGAMELAMAADIRLASDNAVFIMPEVKLGIPSVLDSVLLQQHVGLGLAKEMLLLGEPVSVDRINQFGFINEVVAQDKLIETAEAYAAKVDEIDPFTVRQQKDLFETWQNASLDVAIQDSMNQFALAFSTSVPQRKMGHVLGVKS